MPSVKLEFNKDMNEVEPILSKLKPLSYSERVALKEWWGEANSQGTIEESDSMWRSTIFPVEKAKIKHKEEEWI